MPQRSRAREPKRLLTDAIQYRHDPRNHAQCVPCPSPKTVSLSNSSKALRSNATSLPEPSSTTDTRSKPFDFLGANQVNRAATKPTTGHACAVRALDVLCQFHHSIQLFRTNFVIVAQTLVRLGHQLSKTIQIALFECFSRSTLPARPASATISIGVSIVLRGIDLSPAEVRMTKCERRTPTTLSSVVFPRKRASGDWHFRE